MTDHAEKLAQPAQVTNSCPVCDARAANEPPFPYDQRNVCVATTGDWAGFVFVRHMDGVNWTSAAKLTDMTFRMLLQQHGADVAARAAKGER